MGNLFIRLLLFLSSYAPLALIFFILLRKANPCAAWIILGVAIASIIGMLIYLKMAQKISPISITVSGLQRKDGEALSYIASYIMPFIVVPSDGFDKGLALSVFFVVLAVLYINSNMIHINPSLNLIGYHLYEVNLADGGTHALLSKKRIALNQTLNAVKIGDDILLEKDG